MGKGRGFIWSEKEFFCTEKEFKEKVEKLLRDKERREIERRKKKEQTQLEKKARET